LRYCNAAILAVGEVIVLTRFFLSFLISMMVLAVPLTVRAETIAELNGEYDRLSRAEGAILDQIDNISAMLNAPDAVLVGNPEGPIYAAPRAALRESLGKAADYAQILSLDDAYLSTLSGWSRLAAEALMSREVMVSVAMARLEKADPRLRRIEREKIAALQEILEDTRTRAAKVLARRDALRVYVQTGESVTGGDPEADIPVGTGSGGGGSWSDTGSSKPGAAIAAGAGSGPETNPVCLDENIAVDHLASFHKIGYGASYGYPVKGDYICREPLAFQYIGGGHVVWYKCDRDDPHGCTPADAPGLSYKVETSDAGNRVLKTEDGGWIELHPPS
jgi:hypothetical protein